MINNERLAILKNELSLELTDDKIEKLNEWEKLFKNYNAHTNLMSKNDVEVLFEKHVFDSLAILKWKKFYPEKDLKIVDIGTGGGLPSIILSICFENLKIIANDSKIKKINFIVEAKEALKLKNLGISYARIEELEPLNCDLALSRAVGKIKEIYNLSKKHIKKDGFFLTYKAKNIEKETENLENDFEIIPYKLPLKDNYERSLVILRN